MIRQSSVLSVEYNWLKGQKQCVTMRDTTSTRGKNLQHNKALSFIEMGNMSKVNIMFPEYSIKSKWEQKLSDKTTSVMTSF